MPKFQFTASIRTSGAKEYYSGDVEADNEVQAAEQVAEHTHVNNIGQARTVYINDTAHMPRRR
ncbi:hypothetical protein [Streptomyces murinus]|uniref:hypothetical protein n=1 Tax=Streptomyces murinus TaxID=33900 RepID=UPI00382F5031